MAGPNRYSRFIGWVRVILPLLAIALLSTLFLFARRPDPDAAIPFADADVEALARDQQIGEPRFAGTLPDGTPVTLNAARIAPIGGTASRFAAIAIEGRVTEADGVDAILTAETGVLDTAEQSLALRNDVRVVQGDRTLRTEVLQLNFEANLAIAPQEVQIVGPGLQLTAGRMRAEQAQGGVDVTFTDGVQVLYSPQN